MNAVDPRKADRRGGFALIVTLIMVTLAAIIVVALLVNATSERTTATSYASRFAAELAAQSGLEAAKQALLGSPTGGIPVANDDTFFVIRADGAQTNSTGVKDAYYYLAKAQPGSANAVDFYPLFSTPSATVAPTPLPVNHVTVSPLPTPAAPASPFPNPAREVFGATTKNYPQTYSFIQPPYTQWQEVPDPNDLAAPPAHSLPYMRYTYWMEDLAGYLDASVAGNELVGGYHQRTAGTNPNEIALFTLFDPANPVDSGQTAAKSLIDNRPALITGPTVAQLASGSANVAQSNLAVRLGIDSGGERNLIPFGFGYRDEGQAKTNLNTLIADASKTDDQKVTALAKVIDDNRPQFAAKRKGALPTTEDYSKTLAANIVGYATGAPLVGTGYRGIGLYPLIVEFYERFIWEKDAGETTYYYQQGGTWWANVRVTGYVQLWNMFNKPINSGTLEFQDINRFYAYVGGDSEPHRFEDSFGTNVTTFSSGNQMQPNEFRVIKVYEHLYKFNSGLTVYPTGTNVKLSGESANGPDPSNCGYMAKWNGKVVERAGGGLLDGARGDGSDAYPNLNYVGLERTGSTLTRPTAASDPKWRGTLPGLRYQLPSTFNETIYNLGDPRSAYYIGIRQADVSYNVQSSWWGRIYQNGLVSQSGWKAAETTIGTWPDGGHSTGKGTLPPSTSVDPMALTQAAPEVTKAPSYAGGTGKYDSITDLSRIYDPIQWKPGNFPPASRADFDSKWQNAWKTSMVSDLDYGCASTLHIGSPEFANFDTDDSRSARLLDLFTISDRPSARGLVNLNTASRDALRALAAGIKINSDSVDGAMIPATVDGPVIDPANPTQADKFADAVIQSRPFLTRSQLSSIATNPADRTTSFFGNSAQWTSGGPTEWNDAARESYFGRMFNLTTVRSRNFRVFVTGQLVDPRIHNAAGTPTVLSTVNRVYQLYLNPIRDATGKITSQRCDITYEKDL